MGRLAAIVLSGGSGKRMNSPVPKQYMMLGDKPMLAYSLIAFEKSNVDDIVIVCREGDEDYIRTEFVSGYNLKKVHSVVKGGNERYDSVYCGLLACAEDTEYVLIHDGARPYVSDEIICRNIEGVSLYNAVVTAVTSTDTIKIADKNGFIKETPDRSECYCMQTPQSFEYNLVLESYRKYMEEISDGSLLKVTDDAQVVELYSDTKVKIVEGEYTNIKITNPSDLK